MPTPPPVLRILTEAADYFDSYDEGLFWSSGQPSLRVLGLGGDDDIAVYWYGARVAAGDGDDVVYLYGDGSVATGEAGNDTLIGAGHGIALYGGDGDDVLELRGKWISFSDSDRRRVEPENSIVSGGAGNDTIILSGNGNRGYGGDGDDFLTVTFGGGNVLYGGNGNDYFELFGDPDTTGPGNTAYGGWGDDYFFSNRDYNTMDGQAGNDSFVLQTVRNNLADGGAGNDSFEALGGSGNMLRGGGGNDSMWVINGTGYTLVGGRGKDTMTFTLAFGNRADYQNTFRFESILDSARGAANADVIEGFAPGFDKLDLAGIAAEAGLASLVWSGGKWFSGTAGEVIARPWGTSGFLRVMIDIDGDSQVDSSIMLKGLAAGALSAADFILG